MCRRYRDTGGERETGLDTRDVYTDEETMKSAEREENNSGENVVVVGCLGTPN